MWVTIKCGSVFFVMMEHVIECNSVALDALIVLGPHGGLGGTVEK